jgi:hypothetical protein
VARHQRTVSAALLELGSERSADAPGRAGEQD